MNLSYIKGNTNYELANHTSVMLSTGLGNVLAIVSDRLFSTETYSGSGIVEHYSADIVSSNDYYLFGMQMPGRSFSSNQYRYGFNGKEKDPEGMGGGGTTYDYGFRIYNPQIAKFLSVDPLTSSYPWYTPYQFAGHMPIWAIDLDGLEEYIVTNVYTKDKNGSYIYVKTETKLLDEVGQLGYGRLHLYADEDGNLISKPNYTSTVLDKTKNLWQRIKTPDISKSMKWLWEVLSKESGILVYGDADGNEDSPGTKNKGWFASFDFSAFNKIMSEVTIAVKNESEQSHRLNPKEKIEAIEEIVEKVRKFKAEEKSDKGPTSSNQEPKLPEIDSCGTCGRWIDNSTKKPVSDTTGRKKSNKVITVDEHKQ